MLPDPISRLQLVVQEIDKTFGAGFAAANPDLVAATMTSAALDYGALVLAKAITSVGEALLVDAESRPRHRASAWPGAAAVTHGKPA
jgi:hypothetical protein